MKKNKKRNAEVEALEEKKGADVKGKPSFGLEEIDDEGLTITKLEPTPLPRQQQPARPVQPQQQVMRPDAPASRDQLPLDAAVLKPVPGGLQPIIAPKGSVQLAPVVVPVAFVPYSTQNQPLLQYDKKPRPVAAPQGQPKLEEIKDQPLDKKAARAAKNKEEAPKFVADEEEETVDVGKKNKTKNRVFSAIMFILTLGFFAIVVLNFFAGTLKIDGNNIITGEPNIIKGWMNFSADNLVGKIPLFLATAACAIALATLIVEFVSICNGRGYHVWISALLMTIIMAVGTLLSAFDVLGASDIPLKPFVDGPSVSWLLTFASALLLIFGLIFIPRKPKLAEEDDDLSDLI